METTSIQIKSAREIHEIRSPQFANSFWNNEMLNNIFQIRYSRFAKVSPSGFIFFTASVMRGFRRVVFFYVINREGLIFCPSSETFKNHKDAEKAAFEFVEKEIENHV